MDLEREKLERVDRKLLARLGHDEIYQMVRVPATAATWSTWKRYCGASGTSMGRGIVALIERALGLVDDDDAASVGSTGDVQEQLASREAEMDAREERLDVRERALEIEADQIAAEAKRLATWQARLRSLERDLETRSRPTDRVTDFPAEGGTGSSVERVAITGGWMRGVCPP